MLKLTYLTLSEYFTAGLSLSNLADGLPGEFQRGFNRQIIRETGPWPGLNQSRGSEWSQVSSQVTTLMLTCEVIYLRL